MSEGANPSPQPPPPRGEGEQDKTPPSPLAPPSLPGKGAGGLGRRRLVRLGAVVVLVAAAAFAGWHFLLREPRDDLERFQGEWRLTDARQGPAGEDAVRVAVRVDGDRWQYLHGGGEGRAFRLSLNEAADPKEIDLELVPDRPLVGEPVKMQGVYAFDGNARVRVRLSVGRQPRPRSLDDPDAADWVLTRVRLEPAPAPKR